MPEDVALRIHAVATEALKKPEVRQAIAAGGSTPADPMTLKALSREYAGDIERYRAIAKAINLQPQQ